MGGDEEHPLVFRACAGPSEGLERDELVVEMDPRMRIPRRTHPIAEDEADPAVRLDAIADVIQPVEDMAAVEGRLEPLQGEALAGALGAHQDRQVAEFEVNVGDVGEVLDAEARHCADRSTGASPESITRREGWTLAQSNRLSISTD